MSKQLRDYFKNTDCKNHSQNCGHNHEQSHHTCGFNALTNGIGYDDLNELLKKPESLDFIFGMILLTIKGF